jgi:hypothetical protein
MPASREVAETSIGTPSRTTEEGVTAIAEHFGLDAAALRRVVEEGVD